MSSTADGDRFHFPHMVAQELLREARDPVAGSGAARVRSDRDLGIFYTSDEEDTGTRLGSMAVVMGRGVATLWRFGNDTGDDVNLTQGRRFGADRP